MRLLDPFAGIKLATGHPLFHGAFFVGSYVVNFYYDPENWCTHDCENIMDSQNMQSKFIVIKLTCVSFRSHKRILHITLGPSLGIHLWYYFFRPKLGI